MAIITELPLEIIQTIIRNVKPRDLGRLSTTCKTFAKVVKDPLLIKNIYLQFLDDPHVPDYDYEKYLHDTVWFEALLRPPIPGPINHLARKTHNASFVLKTALHFFQHSSDDPTNSLNLQYIKRLFREYRHNDRIFILKSLSIYERRRDNHRPNRYRNPLISCLPPHEAQLAAKLHVVRGITHCEATWGFPYAASAIYDLRNYTQENFWGPFKSDGMATVDWEKIEAIMIVLTYNLSRYDYPGSGWIRTQWNTKTWDGRAKLGTYKHINIRDTESLPIKAKDWDPYNVTGTYLRVVTFLDFNELFHYNFVEEPRLPPPGQHRRPLRHTAEAIRMIIVEITATKMEAPDKNDGQDLPVIHFEGTSRSMHAAWDPNANSAIRGTVRQTREGEIRWTSVSVYGGEERWKSEAIQVGGISSTRGIVGHWFDKDFDRHGPAGPTAFWKISDDVLGPEEAQQKHLRNFFHDDSILAELGIVEEDIDGEIEEAETDSEEEGEDSEEEDEYIMQYLIEGSIQ